MGVCVAGCYTDLRLPSSCTPHSPRFAGRSLSVCNSPFSKTGPVSSRKHGIVMLQLYSPQPSPLMKLFRPWKLLSLGAPKRRLLCAASASLPEEGMGTNAAGRRSRNTMRPRDGSAHASGCRTESNTYSPTSTTMPFRKLTGDLQRTIQRAVTRQGVGLHRGEHTVVRLVPAMAGEGRYFVRVPVATALAREANAEEGGKDGEVVREEKLPAVIGFVVETLLSTTLGSGGGGGREGETTMGGLRVQTVEHLLSALEGMRVDNVRIEIGNASDVTEIPILDGSAKGWVDAIEEAGLAVALDRDRRSRPSFALAPQKPVMVHEGESFVIAVPSKAPCVTYGIDFPQLPVVGRQWYTWNVAEGSCGCSGYDTDIAPARTFGIYEQVEELRAKGLIKGGSFENALLCSMKSGWVNPPLRFENEPCRHKMLDLIGDMALCSEKGNPGMPIAHVVAYKLKGCDEFGLRRDVNPPHQLLTNHAMLLHDKIPEKKL